MTTDEWDVTDDAALEAWKQTTTGHLAGVWASLRLLRASIGREFLAVRRRLGLR